MGSRKKKTFRKGLRIQHWPKGLQCNMADLQAKYMQITCKKHASKILHELLHAPHLHLNCVFFGKG